jgi:hypothetical protein
VADDVQPAECVASGEGIKLVCNQSCRSVDRNSVVAPEPSGEIERHHSEAVVAEPIFHHVPDVPGLKEAVKQEDKLRMGRKVIVPSNKVAAEIDLTNTAQLAAHTTDESLSERAR